MLWGSTRLGHRLYISSEGCYIGPLQYHIDRGTCGGVYGMWRVHFYVLLLLYLIN